MNQQAWILAQSVAGSFWSRPWKDLFPLFDVWWQQALWVITVYAVTLTLSGRLLMWAGLIPRAVVQPSTPAAVAADGGRIIGKCENIITVTLVLLGQYEGLGLVFAAKSIARMEQIKTNASYYLGGTMLNLVWSIGMGLLARAGAVGV